MQIYIVRGTRQFYFVMRGLIYTGERKSVVRSVMVMDHYLALISRGALEFSRIASVDEYMLLESKCVN